MEAKIQLKMAKYVNGVGLVVEFCVLEGILKPGMKTEFKGRVFETDKRILAVENHMEARRALFLESNLFFLPITKSGKEIPEEKRGQVPFLEKFNKV